MITKEVVQFREHRISIPEAVSSSIEWSDNYDTTINGKLINISEYGAKVEVESDKVFFQLGTCLKNVSIKIKEKLIYKGSVRVISDSIGKDGFQALGLNLIEGIDVETVKSLLGNIEKSNIPDSLRLLEMMPLIRSDFKENLADLLVLLEDLKNRCSLDEVNILNTIDNLDPKSNEKAKIAENTLIELAMSLYFDPIHKIMNKFHKISITFKDEDVVLHKKYFQASVHPIMVKNTPFFNRALTKPLGYPGDYGLMLMFYNYENMGETLFDKFLHCFGCHSPAANANKNRIYLLAEELLKNYKLSKEIRDQVFRVSIFACGPAKEIELFLSSIANIDGPPVEIILIDSEKQALESAKSSLTKLININLKVKLKIYEEDAVLGAIRGRDFMKSIKNSNVIISAGLFDYLNFRVASKLIDVLIPNMSDRGVIIIGNVSNENPDVFGMDYLMDWNLILRSNQDLLDLVSKKNKDDFNLTTKVYAESLGLNLFLEITNNHSNGN